MNQIIRHAVNQSMEQPISEAIKSTELVGSVTQIDIMQSHVKPCKIMYCVLSGSYALHAGIQQLSKLKQPISLKSTSTDLTTMTPTSQPPSRSAIEITHQSSIME